MCRKAKLAVIAGDESIDRVLLPAILCSGRRLQITIMNNVPYSKQLESINHIIEQSLKIEAGSLVRQLKGLMERKSRKYARR